MIEPSGMYCTCRTGRSFNMVIFTVTPSVKKRGPSGNFVGVGLPMQCARGVAGETVPDWFTGGDMLAAGGFCYRMPAWPTEDRS